MPKRNFLIGCVIVLVLVSVAVLHGSGTLASAKETEIDFYDSTGTAIAYADLEDEATIYLWSGKPVGYIEDDHVYGFNGKHLAWFEKGRIYDKNGALAGAPADDFVTPPKIAPFKSFKQFKPFKSFQAFAPFKPSLVDRWSKTKLTLILAAGIR
ncbi:MAG: hypothetical protein JWO13_2745 [Acidobacteriales bacterium]|nr:hypothetical protein [Terriglobales bacterium]